MLRCSEGGEHAPWSLFEAIYCTHFGFELGEGWHINLELELTINVISAYQVPLSFEDIAFLLPNQNVLLKSILFYLIKQYIIHAVHINYCTEYLKNLTHVVLFSLIYKERNHTYVKVWKHILGNDTFSHFWLLILIFL